MHPGLGRFVWWMVPNKCCNIGRKMPKIIYHGVIVSLHKKLAF